MSAPQLHVSLVGRPASPWSRVLDLMLATAGTHVACVMPVATARDTMRRLGR
jgi:hypothetical protein